MSVNTASVIESISLPAYVIIYMVILLLSVNIDFKFDIEGGFKYHHLGKILTAVCLLTNYIAINIACHFDLFIYLNIEILCGSSHLMRVKFVCGIDV